MHHADADHTGRHIHVAHRHERAPCFAAHEVFRRQRHDHDDGEGEQILAARGLKREAKNLDMRRGNDARGTVVREPAELLQRPEDEELAGQCRHGKIEALDPQARQSEHDPHGRSADAAQRERHQDRHAVDAQLEVVGHERAHGHEGRRSERKLASVTGQDVQTECGKRKNQEGREDGAHPVLVGDHRHDHKGKYQKQAHADAILADREDLAILPVRRTELAGFTIEHGDPFSDPVDDLVAPAHVGFANMSLH